jgi:hypothetical protein
VYLQIDSYIHPAFQYELYVFGKKVAYKILVKLTTALKKCHTENGGLACIKAIPQLSSCFA